MIKLVIFDFDQTLADTRHLGYMREKGMWNEVLNDASDLKLYDGMREVLDWLEETTIKVAVVTSLPELIATRLCEITGVKHAALGWG